MKPSLRYALVGMGALGALSLVHWGRRVQYQGPEMVVYLMGVMPNAAAAVAIPFVLLSLWADQSPDATPAAARRAFVVLTLFAAIALIAWEFLQRSSSALVFDRHDIGATFVGLALGYVLFILLTPRGLSLADHNGSSPDPRTD